MVARLPVYPARRQPSRRSAHSPLADGDDVARRPLARRELDVRGVGRIARVISLDRTRAPRPLRGLSPRTCDTARAGLADVRACERNLGILPCSLLRER